MTRPVRFQPVALGRDLASLAPRLTTVGSGALRRRLNLVNDSVTVIDPGIDNVKLKYFLPGRFDLFLPTPRASVTVPVAPAQAISASTVFEAADPASPQRFVIPEFHLGEQVLDGHGTFEVSLRQITATSSQLKVQFSKAARAGGDEIGGDVSAQLRFVSVGAQQSVDFTVTADGDQYTAVRDIANNNERDELYRALSDPAGRTVFAALYSCELAVPADGQPGQYWVRRQTVDVDLDRTPFVFDPAQHPYVFQGISGVGSAPPDVIDRTVAWQGRTHHYFQSTARPAEFSYLPDAVKVVRRIDSDVWRPAITVTFASDDGTLEKTRASIEYEAAPEYDAERLEAARDALAVQVPATADGTPEVTMRPLVVADSAQLRLTVALPPQAPGAPTAVDRPGVVTSLTDSFRDLIEAVPMPSFQQVYDALFGRSGVFFTGGLHVAGEGGRPEVVIPFSGRLDDLVGPLVEVSQTSSASGAVTVDLANRCESPVEVAALPAMTVAEDGTTRAVTASGFTIAGAAVALPATVPAGSTLTAALTGIADPRPPAAGGTTATVAAPAVALDLTGITAAPDADAVWAAIVNPSVPAVYHRTVQVVAFDSMFAPVTDVQAIVVDFVAGGSVIVRPGQLEGSADVQVPLADVVLRHGADSTYAYTQVTVRGAGQIRSAKTDTLDVLVPQADPVTDRPGPADPAGGGS